MAKIADIDLGDFPLLLAPMEDVSDPPFRALCKQQGCDMMYTEFISVEGLIRDATKSVQKLDIYEEERPIGVQIFGAELDSMMRAAEIVEEAKPEVLDINFGCPVKKVVCKMAGAGILQDIPRMVELTKAVVNSTNLPVTVKTRLGWDEQSKKIEEVAERNDERYKVYKRVKQVSQKESFYHTVKRCATGIKKVVMRCATNTLCFQKVTQL